MKMFDLTECYKWVKYIYIEIRQNHMLLNFSGQECNLIKNNLIVYIHIFNLLFINVIFTTINKI